MRGQSKSKSRSRAATRKQPVERAGSRRLRRAAGLGFALAIGLGLWVTWRLSQPSRVRERAAAAERARDWPAAAELWAEFNATGTPDIDSRLSEARTWLAAGYAARAERALSAATAAHPARLEPWLLWLELLRLENRPLEAQRVGWRAYDAVPKDVRRPVLKALTLALLVDTPEEIGRKTLLRWAAVDVADADARVALLRRFADDPRLGDPDRYARVDELSVLLRSVPKHVGTREALILDMLEGGDERQAYALLDDWPEDGRDARYHRLVGRRELEFNRRPERAIAPYQKALAELPIDWKTQYGLARAFRAARRDDEGRAAAEIVTRLRELLDPESLGPRIDKALAKLDEPASRADLADLCERVGLDRLARAWRIDSAAASPPGRLGDDSRFSHPAADRPIHGP